MDPFTLEFQADRWRRLHVRGKNYHASGCHRCSVRPKPGTPFEKTNCARCTHADSIAQGHQRGFSWDELAPVQGIALDQVQIAMREAVGEDAQDDPGGGDFDFSRKDPEQEESPLAEVAEKMAGVLFASAKDSLALACRLGGADLDEVKQRVVELEFLPEDGPTLGSRRNWQQFKDLRERHDELMRVFSVRAVAQRIADALSRIPALAHLAVPLPTSDDELETFVPGIHQAFPELTFEQCASLEAFFRRWSCQRPNFISTLQRRMGGASLSECKRGVSTQAVYWQLGVVTAMMPELRAAFPRLYGGAGLKERRPLNPPTDTKGINET